MSLYDNAHPDQLEFPPHFDRADNYLLLIDEDLKMQVNGQVMVRLKEEKDCWIPYQDIALEKLKDLAARSVASRIELQGRNTDVSLVERQS